MIKLSHGEIKEAYANRLNAFLDKAPFKLKEFMKTLPKMREGIFLKAYEGKSPTSGIKAKCLDCSCMQPQEITNCEAVTCPLWSYRPYQKGKTNE